MAQAVLQGDGRLGARAAQAALGPVGVAADGLSTAWVPPVPSYRPQPLPAVRPSAPLGTEQIERLSRRTGEWGALGAPLRAEMDRAVVRPGGRAPWRRVVVEGTGESMGGARDLAFASMRGGEAVDGAGGFRAAHFIIGNGTRSPDGSLERTARPLDGEVVVVAMVGDFSLQEPTVAQLRALTELVDYARAKTGVIPVEVGDAARAPVAGAVLQAAFNAGLAAHPADDPPRS